MAECLIGLGSNEDDPVERVRDALETLGQHTCVQSLVCSSFHRTRPIGGPAGQPEFCNAAARLRTALGPWSLLRLLRQVEQRLGRVRRQRWGARRIDLDLLLYDQLVLDDPALTIPHPRMAFRRFVLEPAVEVAGDLVHPTIGWSVSRVLDHLRRSPVYLAVGGASSELRRRLVNRVAAGVGAQPVHAERTDAWFRETCASATGPAPTAALEFLQRHVVRLREAGGARVGEPVISDFCLVQWGAVGACCLPSAYSTNWETHWRQLVDQAPVSSLLVLWDGPDPDPRGLDECWARESRRWLIAGHEGPLMRLGAISLDDACVELAAALEAMLRA